MKKIICVHLYNDFSGSPLVLSTVINGFLKAGKNVTLMTSDSQGFLSNLKVKKEEISYQFQSNKFIRLLHLLFNQWRLFWKIFAYRNEDVQIYINTLLPFGAALAGKLIGKEVIYHVHECYLRPMILKRFLKFVVRISAKKVIYVSNYLQKAEEIIPGISKVIPNALSKDFSDSALRFVKNPTDKNFPFTILMLCSLKKFKGLDQFVAIARNLPQYRFKLVLNAETPAINKYFDMEVMPKNLIIFPRQKNVHWFYQNAHLVLNLTNPDLVVETFGMTILEAFIYGLPAIAPPIGGPAEIVQDKQNGYLISPHKIAAITLAIKSLAENETLYTTLSQNALQTAKSYQESCFNKAILATLGEEKFKLVKAKKTTTLQQEPISPLY